MAGSYRQPQKRAQKGDTPEIRSRTTTVTITVPSCAVAHDTTTENSASGPGAIDGREDHRSLQSANGSNPALRPPSADTTEEDSTAHDFSRSTLNGMPSDHARRSRCRRPKRAEGDRRRLKESEKGTFSEARPKIAILNSEPVPPASQRGGAWWAKQRGSVGDEPQHAVDPKDHKCARCRRPTTAVSCATAHDMTTD